MKEQDLGNGQTLNQIVVKELVRGLSFEQIADKLELDVQDIVDVWQEYVSDKRAMPWEEQWLLHLLRLEKLLDTAWTVLSNELDADSINAVAKVLEKIEELQSLNISRKEKMQGEVLAMTQAQSMLMLQAFAVLQEQLKNQITQAFEGRTIKAIRGELLDDFDNKFRTLEKLSLKEIASES